MRFAGWGKYVPSKELTNRDLICFFEVNNDRVKPREKPLSEEEAVQLITSPEADALDTWIQKRTGIRKRHWCSDGENAVTLGERAAREALKVARVRVGKLGAVICASETNPIECPCLASQIAHRLRAKRALCFDIKGACCGFILGLQTARALLGCYEYVLVIASEALSSLINKTDVDTAVLFGDGAGALLVTRGSEADEMFQAAGMSEPDRWDILMIEKGEIIMEGRKVFETAVKGMREETLEAIKGAKIRLKDIDHFFFHQANSRITDALIKSLGIPPHKVYANIHNYGNTSAASIPIAICETVQSGVLKFGDIIAMAATGAGMTSVAIIVKWQDGRPKPSKLRRNILAALIKTRRRLASLSKKRQSIIKMR